MNPLVVLVALVAVCRSRSQPAPSPRRSSWVVRVLETYAAPIGLAVGYALGTILAVVAVDWWYAR